MDSKWLFYRTQDDFEDLKDMIASASSTEDKCMLKCFAYTFATMRQIIAAGMQAEANNICCDLQTAMVEYANLIKNNPLHDQNIERSIWYFCKENLNDINHFINED